MAANDGVPPAPSAATPYQAVTTRDVKRRRSKKSGKTYERWSREFFDELARHGNKSIAAKVAGIASETAYRLVRQDDEFRARYQAAMDAASDVLEAEAWRRGVEGVEVPVYQNGKRVGEVRKFSDTLLSLLLRAAKPAKYREQHTVEHAGPGGGPVQLQPVPFDFHGFACAFEVAIASARPQVGDADRRRLAPADGPAESLDALDADAEAGGVSGAAEA